MRNLAASLTIPLSSSDHHLAERFWRQQSNPQKAKQVYLNTLAVSAVNFYLRCLGVETDWQASQSWNPIMQSLMDIADLEVKHRGKLECRPVLPGMQAVHIPPEVQSDRIGYIAVGFDSSLQKATLLGFIETVGTEELPISQLGSLEDLLEHLSCATQAKTVQGRVNLSQWFEDRFEASWQSLESLLGSGSEQLAFSLRGALQLQETSVKRAKLIDLGLQLGNQSLVLLMALIQEAEQKVAIQVQVHPAETYLPPHLRLVLLSESGATLQEVQSRSRDNYVQLRRFQGVPGECFNIQVGCGEISVTETFVI